MYVLIKKRLILEEKILPQFGFKTLFLAIFKSKLNKVAASRFCQILDMLLYGTNTINGENVSLAFFFHVPTRCKSQQALVTL